MNYKIFIFFLIIFGACSHQKKIELESIMREGQIYLVSYSANETDSIASFYSMDTMLREVYFLSLVDSLDYFYEYDTTGKIASFACTIDTSLVYYAGFDYANGVIETSGEPFILHFDEDRDSFCIATPYSMSIQPLLIPNSTSLAIEIDDEIIEFNLTSEARIDIPEKEYTKILRNYPSDTIVINFRLNSGELFSKNNVGLVVIGTDECN